MADAALDTAGHCAVTAAWRPALLALVLVGAGLLIHAMPGGAGGTLARVGRAGLPAFFVVATLLCAIGMPRQIAAYAGALTFGFWAGGIVALMSQTLACAIDLVWARAFGRDWARRHMLGRFGGRVSRIDALLSANPFTATLTLRLLPVGNNLALNLLAGISGIAGTPFLLASVIGYLPQTIVFALLGAGTRIDQSTQLAFGAVLLACSALGGTLLLKRVPPSRLERLVKMD